MMVGASTLGGAVGGYTTAAWIVILGALDICGSLGRWVREARWEEMAEFIATSTIEGAKWGAIGGVAAAVHPALAVYIIGLGLDKGIEAYRNIEDAGGKRCFLATATAGAVTGGVTGWKTYKWWTKKPYIPPTTDPQEPSYVPPDDNVTVPPDDNVTVPPDDGVVPQEPNITDAANSNSPKPKVHSHYDDGTLVYEGQQPDRLFPRPDPSAEGPYTQLRYDEYNNRIYQGREFDANGNPVRDIDFTSPTYPSGRARPDHTTPRA